MMVSIGTISIIDMSKIGIVGAGIGVVVVGDVGVVGVLEFIREELSKRFATRRGWVYVCIFAR
jgi:hypothetical protein